MLLYLMRHGIAASMVDDPEQGLSAHGREEIERLAYALAARGMFYKNAFHSSKTRARQTAELMTATISPDTELQTYEHLKPNDDPHILHAELDDWQQDTLVVGHLPFMPRLVSLLTDHNPAVSAIDFEPGTVVCLQKDEEGLWSMEWVCSPSLL